MIKNHTSTVPASRTVARIEELLAQAGATAIGKDFRSGKLDALTFQLPINGTLVLIRLPANPQAVYDVMRKRIKRAHKGTLDRLMEQAERTAWKLQQDALEVELTRIALNQTDALQCFLAYVWDGQQTYYQALKSHGFKALLPERSGA